jgi:hypothetical protein
MLTESFIQAESVPTISQNVTELTLPELVPSLIKTASLFVYVMKDAVVNVAAPFLTNPALCFRCLAPWPQWQAFIPAVACGPRPKP